MSLYSINPEIMGSNDDIAVIASNFYLKKAEEIFDAGKYYDIINFQFNGKIIKAERFVAMFTLLNESRRLYGYREL